MTRTALYRHFDSDGRLLYVGISLNAVARLSQHKSQAGWFGNIANVTVEWLDSRQAALNAELQAIHAESPAWNKAGRPAAPPVRVQKPAFQAPARRKPAHVVVHVESARYDGFYVGDGSEDGAEGVRAFMAETYPSDQFAVVPVWRSDAAWLGDEDVLRPSNEDSWSVTRGCCPKELAFERSERLLRQHPSIGASLLREIARHIVIPKAAA